MSDDVFVPALLQGRHAAPAKGCCLMELASFLAGESWSDHPACTDRVMAGWARAANDALDFEQRQSLLPLLGALMGTAGKDRVVSVRLALWCVRQVAHLASGMEVSTAIRSASDWCDDKWDDSSRAAAVWVAQHPTYAVPQRLEPRLLAVNAAIKLATAVSPAGGKPDLRSASSAAFYAATAAARAGMDLVAMTGDLIDEYDRATGRTEHRQITDEELDRYVRTGGLAVSAHQSATTRSHP